MSKHLKKLLSLLLALVMILGMLPTISFAQETKNEPEPEPEAVEVVTPEHEAELQADVLGDIANFYSGMTKRSTYIEKKDFYDAVDDIKEIVLASDTYVEGSLLEHVDDDGNCVGFYWETTTGITCGYFPEHEYKMAVMKANNKASGNRNATASACTNYNSSSADDNDVCLIGPMYSEDTSFTEQYGTEAKSIADALGGTAWKLINNNATIDNIADAISKCRVVIFDSHGNTDWGYFDGGSDGSGEADCVTKANTSYLCLGTGTGITNADMAKATATNANSANSTFYHAYADSDGNYVIDGTAIANHMNSNAPDSMLWMAICLGMSTYGMWQPLRNKGVSVVYGYSQSVSFTGEYDYEEDFWTKMKAGEDVATAFAYMTRTYKWDPAYASSYNTIGKARYNYVAFPNVVSAQDNYQGQRSANPSSTSGTSTTYDAQYGACNIQTVNSTWKLMGDPEPATVTLMAGSSQYGSTISTTTNTATTLPSYTGTVPTGYTFAGWTDSPISGTTTSKPTLYNGTFTPSETSTTLYACFSKLESGNGGSSDDYELYTDSLTEGDYLVVYSNKAMKASIVSNRLSYEEVTPVNDVITTTDATIVWHIAPEGNYWTFYNAEGYAAATSTNNRATLLSSVTDYALWSVTESSGTYDFVNKGNSRYLRENGTYGYAAYGNTTGGPLSLYKNVSGATYTYTTTITTCAHNSLTAHPAVAATCGAAGNSAYWECNTCGSYFSDANATTSIAANSWVIEATGNHTYSGYVSDGASGHHQHCSVCGQDSDTVAHTFGSWTVATAATASSAGTRSHSCDACSYSETKTYYLVSFTVPSGSGVTAPAAQECDDGSSITLPSADNFTYNGANYTFQGWVTADVDNSENAPSTIYSGGYSYSPSASTTLKALYKYSTGGGSGDYELFTDSTLVEGDYIIYSGDGNAMNTTLSSDRLQFDEITVTNDTIAATDVTDSNVWHIAQSGTSWTIYNANESKYVVGTGVKNKIALNAASTDGLFTITNSAEGAVIVSDKNNAAGVNATLRKNGTYGFALYNATQSGDNGKTYLYKKGASGDSYYTTILDSSVHVHTPGAAVQENVVNATCTAAGSYDSVVYCTDCNEELSRETVTVPATGHTPGSYSYDENYHWHVCSVCGQSCGDEAEHEYQFISGTEPTCTTGGTGTYECMICGRTFTDTFPAQGHTAGEPVEENRVDATLSAAGHYDSVVYCIYCNTELSRETITIPQLTGYTVTYHTPAGVSTPAADTVAEGTTITLPTEPNDTPTDYTFLGWTTQSYAVDNTTVVIPISNSYTVNANADLYALYRYSDGTGSGSSDDFELYSGDLSEGDYLIVYDNAAMNTTTTSNRLQYTSVTPTNDVITTTDATIIWHIAPSGTYWTIYNYGESVYAASTGTKNQATTASTSSDKTLWTASGSSTYEFVNKNNSSNSVNANLRKNGTYGFACYSTSTGGALSLYKNVSGGGTDYYTTEVANANCDHNGTLEHVAANAATCTTAGNIEYWHCTDCGKYFSDADAQTQIAQGDTVIAALGHTPGSTYGYDGSNHWHICSVCGEACNDATAHSFDSNGDCVCGATAMLYAKTTTLHEGDHVVLYYPTDALVMTATASGSRLSGVAATVENNKMFAPGDAVVMVVEYVDETAGTFKLKKLGDSTYLTSAATGNGLSFAAAAGENDTDYAIWLFDTDAMSGVTAIKNLNAARNNNAQYLEYYSYYSGFTTYGKTTNSNSFKYYTFEFYACAHAHPVKTDGYAATCTEAGLSDYWTCPDCGKVFSDAACTTETTAAASVIPALGHDLTATTTVEATCTVAGNSAYWTCNTCGKYFSDENGENEIVADSWVIPALGHDFVSHAAQPATCTEIGWDAYDTCSRCDYTTYVEIPATGHTPDAAVEENRFEPTCSMYGSYDSVVYCAVCHEELSREPVELQMLPHTPSNSYEFDSTGHWDTCSVCGARIEETFCPHNCSGSHTTVIEAPTCTEDGESWSYCDSGCGYYEIIPVPATGHSLTETPAVAATCTEAGNNAYWTCDTCGKYFSDENGENEIVEDSWVIPATGHTPAAAVEENRVDATNTTTGSYDSVVYCSVCHAELSRETVAIPALMPMVVGESLTVGGDIDVNLYMAIPAELTQNNSNLTVKLYDGDTLLDTQAVDDAHLTANGYKFQIAKPAKNIQDTVTLKLFNGDEQVAFVSNGTECNELTYSVQIYLESVINNADAYEAQYPGLVDLCKAMSDYGSLAMVHKNYNAASAKALYNAEALAGIDTDTAWLAGDPSDVTVTGNIEGLSFYGASLVMESEMAIRFYFRYTGSANLTCNGEALKANGSYLYVEVSNIDATKFAEGKTVTVSDGANTYTVSGYSVHTYIRQQLQKVKDGKPYDETLVNLVRAIALYGFKAEAFFPANP